MMLRYTDGASGVILFDGTRKLLVEQLVEGTLSIKAQSRQNAFSDYKPSRSRFKDELKNSDNFEAFLEAPERSIKDIILKFMLDDHMETMSDFREALDFIDENMPKDPVLRRCLPDWRNLLGKWKKALANDIISIAYVTQILLREPAQRESTTADRDTTDFSAQCHGAYRSPTRTDFTKLAQEVESLTKRTESTFQALMATMAIVESQKAIAQAETISKLTNLAFFFIPLSLTASVFGMNIVVRKSKHVKDRKR